MQQAKILDVQTIPRRDVPATIRDQLREDDITAMELRIRVSTGEATCYTDWPRADLETPLQPTLDKHGIPHGSLQELVGKTVTVDSVSDYYVVRVNENEP